MGDRKKPKKAARSSRAKGAAAPTMALSAQQDRFVQEYMAEQPYNATAAYKRAGYRAEGQAARTAAARLLKQPAIQAAIAAIRARTAEKFEVTRERVIAEYAKMAFVDPRKFFRDDGTLKHPTEMDDGTAAALQQFEIEEEYEDIPEREDEAQPHGGQLKRTRKRRTAVGQTAKIKWSDKRAALDSIVNLMGWKKEPAQLGTPQNPLTMIVQEMQGRKSALTPSLTPSHDEDDDA